MQDLSMLALPSPGCNTHSIVWSTQTGFESLFLGTLSCYLDTVGVLVCIGIVTGIVSLFAISAIQVYNWVRCGCFYISK